MSVISCWYISLITFLKASSYLSVASGSCIASDTPHTVSATFTNPSLAAGLPGSCMSCTDTGNIQCISKAPGSGADGRCSLPGKCLALTGSLPRTRAPKSCLSSALSVFFFLSYPSVPKQMYRNLQFSPNYLKQYKEYSFSDS